MTDPRSDFLDFGSPIYPCPTERRGVHVLVRLRPGHYACESCGEVFSWKEDDDGTYRLVPVADNGRPPQPSP